MKYHTMTTGQGELALSFLDNPKSNFIILFKNNALFEPAELSVLHTCEQLMAVLTSADKVFTITAVDEEAKSTLRDLGHCALNLNIFRAANAQETVNG